MVKKSIKTPVVTAKPTAKATEKPAQKVPKRSAELERIVVAMNKKFGENAVTLGAPKNDLGEDKAIERISTGSISFDIALGGGIPVGRYFEVSGAYSSTKTAQCLHIVRNAQQQGMVCAYIDVEGTVDDAFLDAFDIDKESLFFSRPDSMEEATQLILDLQQSGAVQLAVIDSIAAMCPNKEQEKQMDESMQMGTPQSLLGKFFRRYQANNNRLARENKTPFTLIGINQLREKIGAYGDPEYSPGGRAKGFTASVDARLRRGDWISEGTGENKEIVGQIVKFKIEKNKTYKRMQTGEFDFYFSENNAGVRPFFNDNIKEVIVCSVEWGVIERTGSWFVYKEQKYQGMTALVSALKDDPALISELKEKVMYLATKKVD